MIHDAQREKIWRFLKKICLIPLTILLAVTHPQAVHASEDYSASRVDVRYEGNGVFLVSIQEGSLGEQIKSTRRIDLHKIVHGYDPSVDPDVPRYTDITAGPALGKLVDQLGHHYGMITLYHVDPPLADIPSKEPGIHRGIDMRTPADMVKSAYSNYVSAVYTDDTDRLSVPSHPIGHFFVKVEASGYPTILTGMTTIRRSDVELVDLTLGQSLGVGGVLLTPQPGRLNSAQEVVNELSLRKRLLRVIDGRFFREKASGGNAGPEYVIEDGNVVFARFKVPHLNAQDAFAMFAEYIYRDQHRIFGSLINRPHKGTGAGCTPFAMSWLKASGVIPFIKEPAVTLRVEERGEVPTLLPDVWNYLLRTADIPWSIVGCDKRVGINKTLPAQYTVYDHLFHEENTTDILSALPGLAEKIRRERGTVISTLFAFGALTPIRDLIIASKRKDPKDTGEYTWANHNQGFPARFWDNGRFSNWIKHMWRVGTPSERITLVREGRFYGIEVDAMDVPRQTAGYFREADRIAVMRENVAERAAASESCRRLFSFELQ